MEEEIWKDIYYFNEPTNEWIDYRGLYQVSNFGRVRSLDRTVKSGKCGVRIYKGKYLKTSKDEKGYLHVQLSKDGIYKNHRISRLVYFTFNPDADTKLQVNHIDEDKSNNRLDNLNLMTAKENCNWGTRSERFIKKIRNHKSMSKSVLQFDKNGNFIKEWISTQEVSRILKLLQPNIWKCCHGERKTCGGFIWKYKEKEAI